MYDLPAAYKNFEPSLGYVKVAGSAKIVGKIDVSSMRKTIIIMRSFAEGIPILCAVL